jgi:hypothetical protein
MGKPFHIVSKRVFPESQHQLDEQLGLVEARNLEGFLGDAHRMTHQRPSHRFTLKTGERDRISSSSRALRIRCVIEFSKT